MERKKIVSLERLRKICKCIHIIHKNLKILIKQYVYIPRQSDLEIYNVIIHILNGGYGSK